MKRLLLTVIFALAALSAGAQDTWDAGSWLDVHVTKSFGNAYAMAHAEHRSCAMFSATDAYFLMAGGGFRFTPFFNADLSYERWGVGSDHTPFDKVVLSLTGTMRREDLSVPVREKVEFLVGGTPTLRSRLRAQYAPASSALRPYAMAEVFTWDNWIRSLYYAGVDVRTGRHSSIDIYYLYHVPAAGVPCHIAGLGLNLTF